MVIAFRVAIVAPQPLNARVLGGHEQNLAVDSCGVARDVVRWARVSERAR
jgi:hypothetical protein